MPISDPDDYYDENSQSEWDRLTATLHGQLEWTGTVAQLESNLPDTGHVLDVGGGAGRYAVWLAEQGYDVTLIDPSTGQRAIAQEKIAEHGHERRVTVGAGDVRDLGFDRDAFDATLCLGGPLSHVLDAGERAAAVRELRRVTKAGGPVFASVMGRLNWLVLSLVGESEHLTNASELAQTGDYDSQFVAQSGHDAAFTETHFFRAAEFEALLEAGGLTIETLVGLEGLASVLAAAPLRQTADELSADERAGVRALVDELREDRTAVDMSAHMLAVCRV
ncbi:class I SAM-dependent methyltransferase [Haloarcula sp. CBA1130]|uniref:class I SAM-dependent methyltransferase n=1 Tax=unclassified Haloarcula TaxID=2624677 RepID=UPI001243E9C3|nr:MULTISPECIES: class I SAM-dependent methyltransferase [unclassified Haloarcula]KAA9399227.1 class I SAM-dependent methyltransferase [Haloarcula sp. CBA1129]KAA9403739.1 class I SAM-dependent methyltransferase [Haloarcula sp. CBA1130]